MSKTRKDKAKFSEAPLKVKARAKRRPKLKRSEATMSESVGSCRFCKKNRKVEIGNIIY